MLTIKAAGVTLHGLGKVGDLKFSTNEHGSLSASWAMILPVGANSPCLRQGVRVEIYAGTWCVWAGVMAEPDRRNGTYTADGLHRLLERYLSLNTSTTTTTVVDTAIDQAIVRGLPLSRPASISATALSTQSETEAQPNTLAALLDQWAENSGRYWRVTNAGQIVAYDLPTTVRWAVQPGVAGLASADDDYASTFFVRYVTSAAGTPPEPTGWSVTSATSPASATRWGVREAYEDVTDLGVINSTAAGQVASAILNAGKARPAYTEGLELFDYQLTTPGGTTPALWQVEAGTQRVRQHGVRDSDGSIAIGGAAEWVIGTTEYTAGSNSISLAPMGLLARTTAAVAAKQAREVRTAFN